MNICSTCGNEISHQSTRCSFCGSVQRRGRPRPGRRKKRVRTVNLEDGRPPVSEGLARLEEELLRACHSGVGLLRIIHGYGSSGIGGSLRIACRRLLQVKLKSRQIKSILPGEEYSGAGGAGSQLINCYPALKESRRTDEGNQGITFVEL